MPEGDTIFKAAAKLRRAVGGQRLQAVDLPRVPAPLPPPGVVVTKVDSHGKWLVVHLDDGHAILTHLRMTGSWQVVRPGRRPPPRSRLRVWLQADSAAAACVDAPIAQLVDQPALARHRGLRALGPDLCDPEPDLDEVVARAARFARHGAPVADLLLDQRVAAGIGNVYKAEVAFLHGLHPLTPNEHVPDDLRRALFATAHDLLRRNLLTQQRTTVPGRRPGSLWVYGREGRACLRCSSSIVGQRAGRDGRTTAWCPSCQPQVRA